MCDGTRRMTRIPSVYPKSMQHIAMFGPTNWSNGELDLPTGPTNRDKRESRKLDSLPVYVACMYTWFMRVCIHGSCAT